jgi:hypothetical protein
MMSKSSVASFFLIASREYTLKMTVVSAATIKGTSTASAVV